jgi:hypothetical protein
MRTARLQHVLPLFLCLFSFPLVAQTIINPLLTPAAQAACGPLQEQPPIPAPDVTLPAQIPPGMARVYIITYALGSTFSHTPSTRIGMDGQWIGQSRPYKYLTVDVPPGVHHFCALMPPHGSVPFSILLMMNMHGGNQVALNWIDAQAGQTYYLLSRTSGANIYASLDRVAANEAGMFLEARPYGASGTSP